jgi:O-antigen/teichoic acid export membrane protein
MYYKGKTGIISIPNMGYTKAAIKGISWMSSFKIATRAMSILKVVILARVLSPAQFGIFGIASLVLVFLQVITETGVNVILIQSKKEISEYVNSAWVISIIRGFIIFLIIVSLSPFIATFFKNSNAIPILLLIGVVPLIDGFINPSEVKFQKELKFNNEFWFRTSIFFVDALTAIIFAVLTHSVYSLIFGLYAGALFELIVSFLIKPTPKLEFKFDYLKELFHKGKWVTAYGILAYFGENGDNIVVGRAMGASPLGIYEMAYTISIAPLSEISDVINQVVFPVYSKIQENRKRLLLAFAKTTLFISLGAAIVGGIIFFFPAQIITILLGTKWLSAVPALRILAIYGILRAVSAPASVVFLAVGRQNYVTVMTFARFAALIVTIYPLVVSFGLVGAAYSALLSVVIEIPVIVFLFIKIFIHTK